MLKIDSDKTIRITRGDAGTIILTAQNSDGTDYTFQVNDVLRLKVTEKSNVSNVVLTKDVTVEEQGTTVDMPLSSTDTRIGDYINKPVSYWYEVELNPETNSNTIIGYDEDGPKEFVIYPEAYNEME